MLQQVQHCSNPKTAPSAAQHLRSQLNEKYEWESFFSKLNFVVLAIIGWQLVYAFLIMPQQASVHYYKVSSGRGDETKLSAIFRNDPTKKEYVRFAEEPKDYFANESWYKVSQEYWRNLPATTDSSMGGFGFLNKEDLQYSNDFLFEIMPLLSVNIHETKGLRALDAGAGVGRVTRGLLMQHFDHVDILEPHSNFMEALKRTVVGSENDDIASVSSGRDNVGSCDEFFDTPLPRFAIESKKYHTVWFQSVLMYLNDEDIVKSLGRALKSIKQSPGGFIIVKEMVSETDNYIINERDNSVVRSEKVWNSLFERAGLKIVLKGEQPSFPEYHFPISMWALISA